MSSPPSTSGNTGTPAPQVPTSTPMPQTSGTPAQTQGGSSPTAGSSTLAKPFVPAKFNLLMLEDDGENYKTWYMALMLAFTNRSIWSIVNGTKPCPTATSDPTGHEEWCLKDCEAQLMILLALKKVGQKCVFRTKTSKEYWDCISSCYSGASGGNKRTVSLLEQFFFMSFKDAEPMQPQVDCCIYAAQQLETVGFPIAENLLVFLLAMRLPESYLMLHTVLTNSDASTITSRWVADCIIREEQHRL